VQSCSICWSKYCPCHELNESNWEVLLNPMNPLMNQYFVVTLKKHGVNGMSNSVLMPVDKMCSLLEFTLDRITHDANKNLEICCSWWHEFMNKSYSYLDAMQMESCFINMLQSCFLNKERVLILVLPKCHLVRLIQGAHFNILTGSPVGPQINQEKGP